MNCNYNYNKTMVALVGQVITSFRCIISSFISKSYANLSSESSESSVTHRWNIPLPQVLHKTLSNEFISAFDEVVVIGDLHGCYDEMRQLLAIIHNSNNCATNETNSDEKSVRNRILKLFVGDLVNKGPKSREVVEYLMDNTDNCLSVRGNHDEVVIREYLRYEKEGEMALKEVNKWIKDMTRRQIDYLMSLSYSISIPCLNALVVHAGIVPNVELNSQNITDLVEMRNLVKRVNESNKQDVYLSATSSHETGEPWVRHWSGPQHIYFGHDAKRKLQRNTFSTGLDTGCVYGNSLTAVFIHGQRKNSFVSVNANQVHSQPKEKSKKPEK